ncbi:MAG: hypothetical protein A2041_07690 [Bacteroidetes bacterium GWA2_31_9b]|nr:MAG: hypothetical protein A2041_07690 [Bacteroidetes bacterium GWA2_31_9b]
MKTQNIIAILSLILTSHLNVYAGWIITQRTYDSDEGVGSALVETVYLQDNIMKVVQGEMITLFNLNTETITLMSTAKKVYWVGNVANYKTDMKSAINQVMNEQLKNASADKQEMIKKVFEGMIASVDNPMQSKSNQPKNYTLEITKTNESQKIAGYTAVKYKVLVNNELKEEAWLSESNRAQDVLDINKFYNLFSDFTAQAGTTEFYQMHEKYLEFARKGFPLKSVNYYGGYETISEVTKLDKEKIDSLVFTIPADYKKASLMEIGLSKEQEE